MGKESGGCETLEMTSLWMQYLPLARSIAAKFTFPPQWQEDAQAEAECALWRACITYDSSRGASFPTYARTVVWKHVRDFSRYMFSAKRSPRNTIPLEWGEPCIHSKHDSIDSIVAAREIMRSLQDVDCSVYLHCICGYKYREIAEILDMKFASVGGRIRENKKKLWRILVKKGILEGDTA